MKKNKSPRADSDQTETAREQRAAPKGAQGNSNIPITPDTAAYHAQRFIERHGDAVDFMLGEALARVRIGKRVSISLLFELARVEHFESFDGKRPIFKLCNTLKPALARLFEQMEPELVGSFDKRKAACDRDIEGVKHGAA